MNINPEILKKCGFELFGSDEYILEYSEEGSILWNETHKYLCIQYYKSEQISTAVKSLRDLQNLYYLLTGNELEIKL